MTVKIVIGLACAGKSTFIKNNFPNSTVVDIFDFQEHARSTEDIWQSYIAAKDVLIKAIKAGDEVVLEHTLLRAIRREMYIDAIKSVTDEPIDIYVVNPSPDIIQERSEKRGCPYHKGEVEEALKVLEIPTKEEGFNNVYIIEE